MDLSKDISGMVSGEYGSQNTAFIPTIPAYLDGLFWLRHPSGGSTCADGILRDAAAGLGFYRQTLALFSAT